MLFNASDRGDVAKQGVFRGVKPALPNREHPKIRTLPFWTLGHTFGFCPDCKALYTAESRRSVFCTLDRVVLCSAHQGPPLHDAGTKD